MNYEMAAATQQGSAPPDALVALADRFDPDVIDLPRGRARVRLEVTGGRHCDAVIAAAGCGSGPRTRARSPTVS
jgi:hypothetical protein